jgi:hypothetical protein
VDFYYETIVITASASQWRLNTTLQAANRWRNDTIVTTSAIFNIVKRTREFLNTPKEVASTRAMSPPYSDFQSSFFEVLASNP